MLKPKKDLGVPKASEDVWRWLQSDEPDEPAPSLVAAADRAKRLVRLQRYGAPRKPAPTPEMLRAAAAAHLADQGCVLWGRAYDLLCEDMDMATDWLTEQVVCVLAELST